MLTFIVGLFWFMLTAAVIFVIVVVAYVLYLIITDCAKTSSLNPASKLAPETSDTETLAHSSDVKFIIHPSDNDTEHITSLNDTILDYLNDRHSPLHYVRYYDHLFSTLDMDSLDIQSMLRYMSEIFDVELPIVDLFGRYGSDPTVYQVLCFISRQRQANS